MYLINYFSTIDVLNSGMPYLLFWIGTLAGILAVYFGTSLLLVIAFFICVALIIHGHNENIYAKWDLVVAFGMIIGAISGHNLTKSLLISGEVCTGNITKQYEYNVSISLDGCFSNSHIRGVVYARCENKGCPKLYAAVSVQVLSRERLGRFAAKGKIVEANMIRHQPWLKQHYYRILSLGNSFREDYFDWLRVDLPVEHSALVTSMLFGETNIPANLTETMKALGLLHVVAISGINIRYLQILVAQVTSKMRRKYRDVGDFLALGLLFVVVGEAVSLFRAIIMCTLQYLLKGGGLLSNKWHFCVGLSLLLMLDASYAFDAGYWLVSGACVGIYLVADWIEKRKFPALLQELAIGIGIWACVAPVQWLIFKEVTGWGIVLGLLLSPLIELVTIVGYFSSLARLVPGFGAFLRAILGILVSIVLSTINTFHGAV